MLVGPNDLLKEVRRGDNDRITKLRNRVLGRLRDKWPTRYSDTEIGAAKTEEVRFIARPYVEQPLDVVCRSFVDYSTRQQPLFDLQNLAPQQFSRLNIYTSADPDLMREAAKIIANSIPSIERRFPPVTAGACGGKNDRMLGAIVALDPQTGEIIAMAGGGGGKDGAQYAKFAVNAIDAPASTIKPFWQAKALAEAKLPSGGRYTAASIIDPTNASINGFRPRAGITGPGRPRTKLAISADDLPQTT